MKFVDICVAIYDYQAQNDEEISFNTDNILYILENNDRDWFKAQLKDGPIGLVPSNYIEKAKSIGSVKALYDYQSRSKEEISFKENDTLVLYEKDDPDWYVVEAPNGDLGLAPSNYVEEVIITAQPSPAPPPTPTIQHQQWAVAIYSFKPEGQEETYLHENEKVLVTENENADWWTVQHHDGTSGIVPASYLQLQDTNEQDSKKKQQQQEEEDRKRQEELRLEQDRKRHEEEQRKKEEQRQKELAEYNRIKELEEKEKERKAEAERRRRLQEEAREIEAKKQQQQLAPPVVPSPQLGSPRRSQIPAPPPPTHNDPNKPNPAKVRTWTDNTGAFKVDAQLISCSNGKIRLHKVNGVKIDVPVGKMCHEDLRYVELETGLKLLAVEDKNDNIPLARLKFNWLDYFKKMNLPHTASTEYAGTFEANQLTEKDIERLTYRQMKMLGMSEKHVHRFQRYIETQRAEPPSDDDEPKPKIKVKKTVTFGGVSIIPYKDEDEDEDDVNWQIEQDERFARQLQEQEQHVGLQRRGTGRPTPAHSAPQNVNFSVLTPQQFQPPVVSTPPVQSTPTIQSLPAAAAPPPPSNQLKPGFQDDAWAPRPSSSPAVNNTRSIATTSQQQQTMVDPELLAKWSGSPALLKANNRPVPAPPVANHFTPVQQQQQPTANNFTPLQQQQPPTANNFTPLQQQHTSNFTPLQQQSTANSFTSLQTNNSFTANGFAHQNSLQQQGSFSSLQQQNSFTGSLQRNNNSNQTSLRFQQHSPMMNHTVQSSPSVYHQAQSVPLQSVLPAPLIPQPTANTSFTPPPVMHQNSFNVVQPQMTGRNWTTATPDNPFGSGAASAAASFQQPQNTGFVPIDPNDKYAVFKTMSAAPSVFNTSSPN